MSMNIDKSLDEIVANKKRAPRPNAARNNSRNDNAGGGRRAPAQPQAAGRAPQQQQQQPRKNTNNNAAIPGLAGIVGDKVVISNLPTDVTEAQIKELMASTVGPFRSASLSFNSKGQSTGVATVQFQKAADATKAYNKYNGRLIDGKRPLKVEIIVDPSRVPPPTLGSRLGAAPSIAVSATVAAAGGNARQPRAQGIAARGGRVAGAGRGGRPKKEVRPKATLESLDAEMSDYQAGAATGEVKAPAV